VSPANTNGGIEGGHGMCRKGTTAPAGSAVGAFYTAHVHESAKRR
jgi:hypothetical protein